ncbi:hypothetical protein ACGGAI_25550 [Streptomyces antibioticus]|uniref:hypothetical protein n=1 Tax=Streptomyces antibioticus TaxID=1890 RepID=UPI003714F0B3
MTNEAPSGVVETSDISINSLGALFVAASSTVIRPVLTSKKLSGRRQVTGLVQFPPGIAHSTYCNHRFNCLVGDRGHLIKNKLEKPNERGHDRRSPTNRFHPTSRLL